MPAELGPSGPRDPLRAIYEREQRRPTRARLFAAAAAVLVLGAFAVIVYYAYHEGVRAGSESVAPLIKAEQTPYKVKPEEPGGMEVPNQDKLIYNEVAPGATAGGKPVERLLPPPESPMPKPTPEQPSAQASQSPPPQTQPEARPPGVPSYVPMPPAPVAIPPVAGSATSTAPQPSSAASLQAPPVPPLTGPVSGQPQQKAVSADQTTAPKKQEPAKSKAPEPAKAAAATPTAPKAAAMASGVWYVQLAAVRSPEDAKREWNRLEGRHKELLGGLTLHIQRVDLGAQKGVFYRIQGGPLADKETANGLCDRLKAVHVGCLAVKP
jgi:cell division septation protein DedD